MFEAQVGQGSLWKKVIDSIKELVTEANLDCTPGGISLQAMDTSHVALVNLLLRQEGFKEYKCARQVLLGLNLTSLAKVLKATENNDEITLRHEDATADVLTLVSEAPHSAKVSEYQLKLMEIEGDAMGIPDQDYKAVVSMPSSEFAKMCRDMQIFGDTVTIEVSREGVKFSGSGDIGNAYSFLKSSGPVPKRKVSAVKKEDVKVKAEQREDLPLDAAFNEDNNADKKAEKKQSAAGGAADAVFVSVSEPVTLSFALRYFMTFSKGSTLSDRVELHMAMDSPCMVEFPIDGMGFMRYYLAPKIDDAADQ